METLKVKLVGIAPLLVHNNQAANPLSPYARAVKPLTSKRKKTDEDFKEIARTEWEAGLYLNEGVVALPARNLERCFHEGAKKSKMGKAYQSGVMVEADYHNLDYRGLKIKMNHNGVIPNPDLDKFFDGHQHADMVKVSGNQVLRTRPIFHDWSLECSLIFDTTVIDRRTLVQAIQAAGKLVGLCEQRPRMGRFEVEEVK